MTALRSTVPLEPVPRHLDLMLIDDHPLLADALARRFAAEGMVVEIADVTIGSQRLLDAAVARSPRLVLLDLGLPIEGGGEGLVGPLVGAGLVVAVLTGETDRLLWARCSAAGSCAVLSKTEPLDDLTSTVERLLRGEEVRPHQRAELAALQRRDDEDRRHRLAGFDQLTGRERQIVAGLLTGRGLRCLAEDHGVSIETIRTQAKSMMRKLGATSQLEVVARANAAGWSGSDLMSIELLDIGTQLAAIGCIIVGFGLVAIGRAPWLGYIFRTAIEPTLTRFRESSELSRAELATGWTVAASALAGVAVVVDRSLFAAVLAILLWLARPAVARLTSEEHPLLALANSFTIDLMIGMYLPITVSQVLLGNLILACSFAALIVALSWPTGGGATGRRFRFVTAS